MSKKITFILPSLKGGGAEKVFINIAYYFVKRKYDVELVTLKSEYDYNCNFNDLKIKYICFNKKRSLYGIWNLFFYLKKTNSKIIFSTIAHLNVMLYLLNFFFKKKIIFRETNNIFLNLKKINPLKKFVLHFFLKKIYKSNIVVYPSLNLKKDIIKKNNILDYNNFVINNPISITMSNYTNDSTLEKIKLIRNKFKKIIINIGSFTVQKNQKDLVESFSKIDEIEKKCLIFIGNGSLKKQINSLIIERGLQNNIFIFNFQNNLIPFFNIADLYVSTSLWEGFPNILLDVANSNIPIIAYNCDYGPSEILENGKYGILCKLGDKDSLSKLINKALTGKINIIPKHHLFSKYSLSFIGKKYENLIQ